MPSYQLYYSQGACSLAVNAILHEIGQSFELTNANQPGSKTRTPEFLAVASRGQVPVLVVDGTPVKEGGAIITYLCDEHKSELLPRAGLERAKALEALMFCNATLHPAYSKAFGGLKGGNDAAVAQACEAIQQLWNEVEEKLGRQPYLAGDKVTAGDILMTVIAGWSGAFGDRIKLGKNVSRVVAEISARPAYQKAVQSESEGAKAAA